MVDAAEALRIGLVNSVVAHDELVPTALDRASAIASADSAAVRAAIALYRRGDGATLEEALTYESEAADAWRTDSIALARAHERHHRQRSGRQVLISWGRASSAGVLARRPRGERNDRHACAGAASQHQVHDRNELVHFDE